MHRNLCTVGGRWERQGVPVRRREERTGFSSAPLQSFTLSSSRRAGWTCCTAAGTVLERRGAAARFTGFRNDLRRDSSGRTDLRRSCVSRASATSRPPRRGAASPGAARRRSGTRPRGEPRSPRRAPSRRAPSPPSGSARRRLPSARRGGDRPPPRPGRRCVTTRICSRAARVRSLRPTASAVAPETPASTSSKTNVRTGPPRRLPRLPVARRLRLRERGRDGELDAGELAPGGDLRERPGRLPRVRGERERDDVDPVRAEGDVLLAGEERAVGQRPSARPRRGTTTRGTRGRRAASPPPSRAAARRPSARRRARAPPSGRRRTPRQRPSPPCGAPPPGRPARPAPGRRPRGTRGPLRASRRTSSSASRGRRAARRRPRAAPGRPRAARGRARSTPRRRRRARSARRRSRGVPRRPGRPRRGRRASAGARSAPAGRPPRPTRAPRRRPPRSRPRFSTLESAAFSRPRDSSSPATGAARSISPIRNSRTSSRAGPSLPSAAIRSRSASFSFHAAWSRSTSAALSESAANRSRSSRGAAGSRSSRASACP